VQLTNAYVAKIHSVSVRVIGERRLTVHTNVSLVPMVGTGRKTDRVHVNEHTMKRTLAMANQQTDFSALFTTVRESLKTLLCQTTRLRGLSALDKIADGQTPRRFCGDSICGHFDCAKLREACRGD